MPKPIAPATRPTPRRAILRLLAGERAVQSRAASAAADAQVFTVEQHFEKLFEIYGRIAAERSTR